MIDEVRFRPQNGPETDSMRQNRSIPEIWTVSDVAGVNRRGTFVQVEAFVQQNFPGTEVLGTSYPVPPVKASL